jgi:hypothetical protein
MTSNNVAKAYRTARNYLKKDDARNNAAKPSFIDVTRMSPGNMMEEYLKQEKSEAEDEVGPQDVMKAIPFSKFHKILIGIHLLLYISSSFVIYNMVYF